MSIQHDKFTAINGKKYENQLLTVLPQELFASKRETVSLKLVLLLDHGLQNQRHFIVNFGRGV